VKVLVEGQRRVRIVEYQANDAYFEASAAPLTEMPGDEATAKGALALGQTYESQSFLEEDSQKLEEALQQYERAASAVPSDTYLHALALMNQGRVHELRGDSEKALAAHATVAENRPAPREDIPGAEDGAPPVIETGDVFMDNLFAEAVEGAERMSFQALAQDRMDRLEGGDQVGQAAEAP